ncbi:Lrp/AsnC family transcriptional regulator [Tahibacter soli]|uniref:Lrp/AsnC family transcriptional regulator n=1 Tax=Tahibacter soli TaxID=2983605 RepID=A0A9X4BGD3_9GAMM|nr:Lrp/AsnC family transcriptional regulator [Tahibacter soli]MDC8012630.1 Lrp/AsnC family transcriptional regulator [Tahibacter soli]
MHALDAKDRQLLDLLCRNARLPLKTLAARVGLARSSLRERVARLEASGVIRGYRADVDWPAQVPLVRAYLVVRLVRTPAPALLARLRERREIERCSSVSGEIDLILAVATDTLDAVTDTRDWLSAQPEVMSVVTETVLREEFRR